MLTKIQKQRISDMAAKSGVRVEQEYKGGDVFHLWIKAHGHLGTNLGAFRKCDIEAASDEVIQRLDSERRAAKAKAVTQ